MRGFNGVWREGFLAPERERNQNCSLQIVVFRQTAFYYFFTLLTKADYTDTTLYIAAV